MQLLFQMFRKLPETTQKVDSNRCHEKTLKCLYLDLQDITPEQILYVHAHADLEQSRLIKIQFKYLDKP